MGLGGIRAECDAGVEFMGSGSPRGIKSARKIKGNWIREYYKVLVTDTQVLCSFIKALKFQDDSWMLK